MPFSEKRIVSRLLGSPLSTQSPRQRVSFSSSQRVPQRPPVSSSDTAVSATLPASCARRAYR
ncbi:Uncharacterised protein [Bordetella pertussis]|nr:Uncharacterised protein [Bordetella pertussis]